MIIDLERLILYSLSFNSVYFNLSGWNLLTLAFLWRYLSIFLGDGFSLYWGFLLLLRGSFFLLS